MTLFKTDDPTLRTPDQKAKPTSMLDDIPFVLSSQTNMTTHNYTSSLEETRKYLLSVKKKIDSDTYDYDFSNERKHVRKL